jgi:hypothetical protein
MSRFHRAREKQMPDSLQDAARRRWLRRLLASGVLGAGGFAGLIQSALAMARAPYPDGLHKIRGQVKINGVPAAAGALVKPGDKVTTGPGSQAVFVVGRDAYLMREDTRIEISGRPAATSTSGEVQEALVNTLRLLSGKLLAAFGRSDKRIVMPTAVIGVRGTVVYLEAEATRGYICTCYGTVDIEATAVPGVRESVTTRYHDAPRYIYGAGVDKPIVAAPVINHTDDEIYMIEHLVGRFPLFHGNDGSYSFKR